MGDGSEGSRPDLDLQFMGSCFGSPQGSWTPVSGPLGPQNLVEPVSCCGCRWGPLAYPPLPNLGCPGIPRAALGQRPGSVGACPGPRTGHIQL